MIKKSITYQNFDKPITKEFYFGLFEADFMELEALWQKDGGFDGRIDKVKQGDDHKLIMDTFRVLIERSFGVKEGEEFFRPTEARDKFLSSDAYSQLLVGLLTKEGPEWDAAAFMEGILPSNVRQLTSMNAGDNPASQQARARSEAQMQGFRKQQATDKDAGFEPVEIPTAAPVLEFANVEDDPDWVKFQEQQRKEAEEKDLTPQQREFLAWKAKQN